MKKYLKFIPIILFLMIFNLGIVSAGTSISDQVGYLQSKYPSGTIHSGTDYGASECMGFAFKMFGEFYGKSPRDVANSYDLNSLQAGDVLTYSGKYTDATWGHTVWVLETHTDYIVVAESNWGGAYNQINWGRILQRSDIYTVKKIYKGDGRKGDPDPYIPKGTKQNLGNNFIAQIRLKSNQNIAIESKGTNTADPVYQGSFSRNNQKQQWNFIRQSDGSYFVKNMATGMYLDLSGDGNTLANVIYVWTLHGQAKNRWYIYDYNGGYRLVPQSADAKRLAIDVPDGTTEVGEQFHLWQAINETNNAQTFVIDILPSSISISPSSANIYVGNTKNLSVVFDSNVNVKDITWKSSNTSVATVSSSGVVTAKGVGTATITATTINGKTATATITVENYKNGLEYNDSTKKWTYYKNGNPDYTYTGLATNTNGTWYVEKGIVTFKYTGFYKDSTGNVYSIEKSKLVKTTGVIKAYDKWYYFKNGKTDFTYTGIATNEKGTWYVEKGIVTFKYNELIQYKGKWTPFVKSKLTSNYTGILSNKKGDWYVKNGEVQFNFNGTYKDSEGNIYIVKAGKVDTTQTTIEKVNNTWYYFNKGKTDFKFNGVATNRNGTWYVNNGIVTFKHNELIQYNGKWVAFVNSELIPTYTGILSNKKGTWYVKNGTVQFNYNGKYKDPSTGKTYQIKNGKVV